MNTNEAILENLLGRDAFHAEEKKVSGIAQKAVSQGYHSLTVPQLAVISPWLSTNCNGSTDPGGHHNGCNIQLVDTAFLEALEETDDVECVQCESCREEDSLYAYQYNKLMDE
jgi:hypothetical protein